jgi:hypothetical protein
VLARIIIVILLFFLCVGGHADTVSVPYVFTPGTVIQSGQVNADFSTIYNAFNGSISDVNIKNGAAINPAKISNLQFSCARVTGVQGSGGVTYAVADATNVGSVYVEPYNGNQVALYDGISQWIACTQGEQVVPLGALTNNAYDIYEYNSGGIATVEATPTVWTNPTTPPARQMINGVWCKGTDPTRRLIASIYVDAGDVCNDNPGERGISNVLQPVPRSLFCNDPAGSFSTASGGTNPLNGNVTNGQGRVTVFHALGSASPAAYQTPTVLTDWLHAVNTAGTYGVTSGIGIDSTNTATVTGQTQSFTTNAIGVATCSLSDSKPAGLHYYQRVGASTGGGTATFYFGSLGNMSGNTWN